MLKNAKIGTKLGIGFGTILLMMFIMSIFSIETFVTVNDDVIFAFDYELTKVTLLNQLWDAIDIVKLNIEDILKTADADTIATLRAGINDSVAEADSLFKEIEPLISEGKDREIYTEVIKLRGEFHKTLQIVFGYLDKKDYDGLMGYFFQFENSESEYIEKVNDLLYLYIDNMNETGVKIKANMHLSIWILVGAIVVALLIAVPLAVVITKMITKPLYSCVDAAERIANGETNLYLEKKSNDELGTLIAAMDDMIASIKKLYEDAVSLSKEAVSGNLKSRIDVKKHKGDFAKIIQGMNDTMEAVVIPIHESMKVMNKLASKDLSIRINGVYQGDFNEFKDDVNSAIKNLEDSLIQVGMSVEQISSASDQINHVSQKLADATSTQASSIEQISTSLEQINVLTGSNSQQAKDGLRLTDIAMNAVDTANVAMDKMNTAMESILASSRQTAAIIKTIDEIAFQTNLLALNAAVEAAHAGEVGKGFAVVADEVKNLSARSADAASNTNVLIEESGKKTQMGSNIVEQVTQSFKEMKEQFNVVKKIVTEIVASSQEQALSISQITNGINEVSRSTQNNAANAEASASTADELHSQASELKDMVEQYVLSRRIK